MTPKFIDAPEKLIVGMGAPFISILSPERNNFIVIPKLWSDYVPRIPEIPHRLNSVTSYGVCSKPPEGCGSNRPDECYYLAGAEVSRIDTLPSRMTSMKIPAGRYAVFTHRGKLDALGHTMNYVYGTWLPTSGIELREAPDLEIYDKRFDPHSEDSELDIWIPVK